DLALIRYRPGRAQQLVVARLNSGRFIGREHFRGGPADHDLSRYAPESLARAVHQYISAVGDALDENRGRDIVDDQIKKRPIAIALLLGQALVGDCPRMSPPSRRCRSDGARREESGFWLPVLRATRSRRLARSPICP